MLKGIGTCLLDQELPGESCRRCLSLREGILTCLLDRPRTCPLMLGTPCSDLPSGVCPPCLPHLSTSPVPVYLTCLPHLSALAEPEGSATKLCHHTKHFEAK